MNVLFEGLTKSYHGKTILANISGGISNGEKIGFIGSNGIGKTTLSRILAGVEPPDMGSIEYTPRNALIIYLEQSPDFQPGASVYQELYQTVSKNAAADQPIDTIVKKR
jgi:ATP-binding cassette subfamily F protein 3